MKRLLSALPLALVLLVPFSAGSTPSGHRWFLNACSSGQCYPGMTCVSNRCLSVARFAASVENRGGASLTGPQGVAYSTVLTRMQDAFRNWTATRVSGCTTAWDINLGGTFTTPQGTTAVNGSDGANNIIWLNGSSWRYSSGTLGLTTTTFYTSTGEITDADMELNNGVNWADNGNVSSFDYESVVLHEAGHYLGLDHTNSSGAAVMYPSIGNGIVKRVLQSSDTNDVCTVYPGASGSQGSPCTSGGQCTGGRVCEGAPSGGQKICTQDCTAAGQTCPTGYSCQPSDNGFACLTQLGATDLCKFCTSGGDCSTGLCLMDNDGHLWCSVSCSSPTQCGNGYNCVSTASGNYCVPTSQCTNQCTTAANCAPGYACSAGLCVPTGNPGDRCEISGICDNCNVCVTDPANQNLAFCRTCCAGAGAGGYCNACTNASCGASGQCVGLASTNDGVCLPSTGAGLCQACDSSTPCQSGLICGAGRCHSSCLPSNPGTCSACFDIGGGNGVCGCSDEIAQEGQPCGPQTGGGLEVCVNGLVCVANPQALCRARCDVNNPNSCRQGEACQLVQGVGVCLPGSEGNKCSPCTTAGTCNAGLTCVLGRCYEPCNINNINACGTCAAQQANGDGVCACQDQIVGEGADCGPPNISSCNAGLVCLTGKCRGQCDPNMAFSCPAGTVCQQIGGQGAFYCQDFVDPGTGGGGGSGSGGGFSGTGGGSAFGGGAGGGSTISEGCGCSSAADTIFLWPLALLGLRRRRRRA